MFGTRKILAGAVSGVVGGLVFPIGSVHQDVEVVPGEALVDRALAQRVVHVEADLLDRLQPQVEAEVLSPGFESSPFAEGALDEVGSTAVGGGNVIAGNGFGGIALTGSGTVVLNNEIGTDVKTEVIAGLTTFMTMATVQMPPIAMILPRLDARPVTRLTATKK